MKRTTRLARAVAALLLGLAPVSAADWAASAEVDLSDGLGEAEAVALALRRNAALQALRGAHAVAEAGRSSARPLPDPELRTGGFEVGDGSRGVWSQTYSLALRWSPPRLFERRWNTASAKARVAEAAGEVAVAEMDVAGEVRLLHNDIVFLDERIRVAGQAAQLRERMLEFAAAQVTAGLKTALDLSAAELALADARVQLAGFRLERAAAMSRLVARLGLPGLREPVLQYDERRLTYAPGEDSPVGAAVAAATRPEMAVLAARCAQAEAELRRRKSERYPWLSFIQVGREFGGPAVPNAWSFRAGVALPVFRWAHNATRVAVVEAEQCRLETEAEVDRAQAEVRILGDRLRARAADIQEFRDRIEPAYARAAAVAEAGVAAGQADELARLAADARLLAQRLAFLERVQDYRRLEISLERLSGGAPLR